MGGTTTNRGYAYPTSGDGFTPHTDLQALAEDVDADVAGIGAYSSYTPTLTNITIGTGGEVYGWYTKLPGGLVHGGFYLVFGTSPSIASTCDISLPEAAWIPGATLIQIAVGSWVYRDQAPTLYHYAGTLATWSSAATSVSMSGAWDGTAPRSRVTSTVPFTVASTDVLSGSFAYRAAA